MKTKRILTAVLLLAAVILAACTKDYKEEDVIKYIREELGADTYNDIVNGNLSPSDEEDFLKTIGLTTARLHNAGMIHHDYSRGNLLLGKNAEGKACVELIDLNRLRFHEISMDEGCQNFAERLPATDVQRHTMAEAYAKERGFDVERCYELMMKYNKEKT